LVAIRPALYWLIRLAVRSPSAVSAPNADRLLDATLVIDGVGWQQDRVIIRRKAGGQ
jgi:hypothetical protein